MQGTAGTLAKEGQEQSSDSAWLYFEPGRRQSKSWLNYDDVNVRHSVK
jgi:hypothetical protein